MEHFYGGTFTRFINKYAKPITVVFLFGVAASTAIWVNGLLPASKPFRFFDEK